jgi:hypothetical protein
MVDMNAWPYNLFSLVNKAAMQAVPTHARETAWVHSRPLRYDSTKISWRGPFEFKT